jgi:putative ABC transport system substrate-binding protein
MPFNTYTKTLAIRFLTPRFAAPVLAAVMLLVLSGPCSIWGAEIIIIGDLNYRQISEVSNEIKTSLRAQVRELNLSDVRGRLGGVVERENARVVVALGADSVAEALKLPPAIQVVYGLIISPPQTSRSNVSGVYMSVPVSEYLVLARRMLPTSTRIAIMGSPQLVSLLATEDFPQAVGIHRIASTTELLDAVDKLSGSQAILLLPDTHLLTSSSLEKIYLHSFKFSRPVLGVSESAVRQGSLFALVFDAKATGKQLGERVRAILQHNDSKEAPHSPPRKFNLYINSNTAEKMKISVPDDLLKKARKVYQ